MGSVKHPRGRLPQRVYWTRRLVVLALALLLVLGIGKVFGGLGADDAPAADTARTTSVEPAEEASTSAAAMGPVPPDRKLLRQHKAARPALAAPSGECSENEVSVVPDVPRASGGGEIAIRLELTGTQPACTFKVSPESMVVKITSGEDRIWSSQDCPAAIPSTSVVVRSAVPAAVPVTWSGRRSDETCSKRTNWALPGFYHVHAAALGSAPSDVQFEVTLPSRPVVTRTAKPKPSPTTSPSVSPTRAGSKPSKPAKPSPSTTRKP